MLQVNINFNSIMDVIPTRWRIHYGFKNIFTRFVRQQELDKSDRKILKLEKPISSISWTRGRMFT